MIKPKKSLGQNFLRNQSIAQFMVSKLEPTNEDTIIEIGPGTGAVTKNLPRDAKKIMAVEYDELAIDDLKKQFKDWPTLEVINQNILDWLPQFDYKNAPIGEKFKIIGSIPYNITSPIMHTVTKLFCKPEKAVFMVQKEVGQKIAGLPHPNYLSNFIQTFFKVNYLMDVKNTEFYPVPKVDSGIIELTKLPAPKVRYEDIHKYEGFLHKTFSQPRKKINKSFDTEILEKTNIDPNLRPHQLSMEKILDLYQATGQQPQRIV